ncbi:MAG: hypothetical protein ACO1N0_18280 [Fluviicola sp.]
MESSVSVSLAKINERLQCKIHILTKYQQKIHFEVLNFTVLDLLFYSYIHRMKSFIAFLITFSSIFCFGQSDSLNFGSNIPSIDLIYGFRTLNRPQFGPDLDKKYSTFSDFKMSSPLQYVGVGITLVAATGSRDNIGNLQFCVYLPQRIHLPDSSLAKSRGFNVGFTFLGIDLLRNTDKIDLIANLGFDAGQLLITGEGIKQRNTYFAPKISLQPKVRIGKIALSLCAEYGYDLTKDKWRKTWFGPGHQNNLVPASNKIGGLSGLSWFVTLGYAY